ncbi:MAG TPA: tripartite tricarboxylate transporter permease [Candidatus Methylomirabilis sp.]|nr:tripartite tricarboxylate transporter permease [Candidatus Methylomirabilis sp.]
MDTFSSLMLGFSVALTPTNLLFAFAGSLFGTIVGILPGLGPAAGTALLIPLTFRLDPTGAIIMLAAIYYGSQYGGTITSVLMNVPGEAASAITCLDGYQMAKQGRAGAALSIAAIGSFIGGTLATLGLVVAAQPLTRVALRFGPVEFFALTVLGIVLVMGLAGKSMVKALIMAVFGLMIGMVGMDPTRGSPRFTFGLVELLDGVGFIPVIMGLFGVAEIFENLESDDRHVIEAQLSTLVPSAADLKASGWAIGRGTVVGFLLGLIPGMTGTASSVLAYVAERKASRYPEKFGTGVIEGVAGPETANNAHANAALIPLFTMGIPASPSIAVLMGAFMMNGLIPGPLLFREHAALAWGVIASLYIGNVILLVLNLPLIPLWVKFLKIPYTILMTIVLAIMMVGAYTVSNTVFDIFVMLLFGIIGYVLRKLDFPLAPIVLTLIMGPPMEKSLRQSLEMSQGDVSILVTSPIAASLLAISAIILFSPMFKFAWKRWIVQPTAQRV